jgi:hypothetical protein
MKLLSYRKLLFLSLLAVISMTANAVLVDRGNGLIYDSDQNLTWTQNAGMSGLMTWGEATAWTGGLVFGGFDDWRLPTTTQHDDPTCSGDIRNSGDFKLFYEHRADCTGGEMELLTYLHDPWRNPLFINIHRLRYWTATPYRDGIDPCIYYPNYDVPCNINNDDGDRKGFYWQWGFTGFQDGGGEYSNIPFKTTLKGGNDRNAWAVRDNCGFNVDLAANTWTMFGLPCDPVETVNNVESVFGDDLDIAQYGIRWVVFEWDADADSYSRLFLTSTLSQNKGYWILSLDEANVDSEGDDTQAVVNISEGCAVSQGCYEIPLTPPTSGETEEYNLVGHTFPVTIPWKDARIKAGGSVYTPSQAQSAIIMDKTIWLYNGNAYDSYDDSTPGLEGQLVPFDGFWVRTLQNAPSDTTLLLPKVPTP